MIKYTEKRISSLLFVTLISLPTLAQNIQGSYRPQADGEIRKQQVEYTVSEAMGHRGSVPLCPFKIRSAESKPKIKETERRVFKQNGRVYERFTECNLWLYKTRAK